MGLLAKPSRSGLLTQRGGVLAVVTMLHVLGLVLAVHARTHVAPAPPAVLLKVAFLDENRPVETPPTLPPPRIEVPPPVEIVMPLVDMPAIDMPNSRAIIAVVTPPPQPPAAATVPLRSDEPVMLDIEQVDYLRVPEPRYPRAAKQARLQGTVLLWVLIGPDGRPREVRIHRSSGHEQLDREGREAVSRALFKPYRQDGEARSAQVIVPVEFALTVRTVQRH